MYGYVKRCAVVCTLKSDLCRAAWVLTGVGIGYGWWQWSGQVPLCLLVFCQVRLPGCGGRHFSR